MIQAKSRDYAWNKGWIEFEAPNGRGVYWLRDKAGQTIFVGKGNIRERLLSHWNHEKPTDLAIWSQKSRGGTQKRVVDATNRYREAPTV